MPSAGRPVGRSRRSPRTDSERTVRGPIGARPRCPSGSRALCTGDGGCGHGARLRTGSPYAVLSVLGDGARPGAGPCVRGWWLRAPGWRLWARCSSRGGVLAAGRGRCPCARGDVTGRPVEGGHREGDGDRALSVRSSMRCPCWTRVRPATVTIAVGGASVLLTVTAEVEGHVNGRGGPPQAAHSARGWAWCGRTGALCTAGVRRGCEARGVLVVMVSHGARPRCGSSGEGESDWLHRWARRYPRMGRHERGRCPSADGDRSAAVSHPQWRVRLEQRPGPVPVQGEGSARTVTLRGR